MKVFLLLIMFICPAFAGDNLEGPNCPQGDAWQFIGFAYCPPDDLGSFSQAISSVRVIQGTQGYMAIPCCKHNDSDLCPGYPPGNYAVSMSKCNPELIAVATRWNMSPRSGGGDMGCNDYGPAVTPCHLMPKAPLMSRMVSKLKGGKKPHKPLEARLGRCKVGKDGLLKLNACVWNETD